MKSEVMVVGFGSLVSGMKWILRRSRILKKCERRGARHRTGEERWILIRSEAVNYEYSFLCWNSDLCHSRHE